MFGITDQVQFQLFFESRKGFISQIVAGRLFQVRGPATISYKFYWIGNLQIFPQTQSCWLHWWVALANFVLL